MKCRHCGEADCSSASCWEKDESPVAHERALRKDVARLSRALSVLVLTPHIRSYLERKDPKALGQALRALQEEA